MSSCCETWDNECFKKQSSGREVKLERYLTSTTQTCGLMSAISFNTRYLGMQSNNNNFTLAQKCLYDRASRTIFLLLRKCRKFMLPVDVQIDLFDKMIRVSTNEYFESMFVHNQHPTVRENLKYICHSYCQSSPNSSSSLK